jgi:drug/metabolite transporter (DMT)-like permease
LIAILASVAGQFFLKAGALKLGKVNVENAISHVLQILTIPELIIGLICYAIGAIVYILVLTRINLSIAAPSAALGYVFAVFISYFLFHETIPIERVVGVGLIICGVVLVAWQKG